MRRVRQWGAAILVAAIAVGCEADGGEEKTIALDTPDTSEMASVHYGPDTLSRAQIDSGRYDTSWRQALADDSLGLGTDTVDGIALDRFPVDTVDTGETFADIGRIEVRREPAMSGPSDSVASRTDTTRRDGTDVAAADTAASVDSVAAIDVESATAGPASADSAPSAVARLPEVHIPLHGPVEGPSVLYAQILLDRARFSPGIVDGRWGKNTEKAVFWFQRANGLEATGSVDSLTYRALVDSAGRPDRFVRTAVLTERDVSGPFVDRIPADVYEQEKLDCMCYTSLSEQIAERFHASTDVLERLNEGVTLDSLTAGDSLVVPNVDRAELDEGLGDIETTAGDRDRIARLRVSDQGHYLHALDDQGRIVYHFPTTLGSEYHPSPSGRYAVQRIAFDPWFHYQPDLLAGADSTKPSARIPPGPNSPVGIVWMDLTKPHYGIHGTPDPSSIGYVMSSGCIRLTNWDAAFLAERLDPEVPVEFTDLRPERTTS